MKNLKIPKIIKENGFDFSWDEKKVWDLGIDVSVIDIEELSWHLEIPFWNFSGDFYNLKPIDVINNPEKFKEHYRRIVKSDINFPIDIMKNKKGKYTILDGLHRLAKLKMNGVQKINVRKIGREFIEKIKI